MPPKRTTRQKKAEAVTSAAEDPQPMEISSENDKENNDGGAEMANWRDEGYLLHSSAADRYFFNGKIVTLNTITKGMRKLKVKGPPDQDTDDEDLSTDCNVACDFAGLQDFLKKRKKTATMDDVEKLRIYLAHGYNILVHGVGSKIDYLENLRKSLYKDYPVLTINGFSEEATTRNIMLQINEGLNLQVEANTRSSLSTWAENIIKKLRHKKQHIYIFFNNIDGIVHRDCADQDAIRILAQSKQIGLIATVDNCNATLLWNTRQDSAFNWVHIYADTFDNSLDETFAGKSRFLGLDNKSNQTTHSVASLDAFWQAISDNSKKIMRLFFLLSFDDVSGKEQSVAFWDLFQESKDRFLVSTDTALNQQLTEFEDHRILRRRRSPDGNEQLSTLVDRALVVKFFEEKNLSLTED